MPKGKEEKEPKEPTVEPEVKEPTEPTTFTQEDLDKAREEGKSEAWEQYQGIQRALSTKDRRIKELESQQPQAPRINQIQREMLDLMAGDAYSDDPTRQGRIQQLRAELTREEQLQAQEIFIRQKRDEVNKKIVDAGLDPNDESLEGVEDAFDLFCVDGKFGRVDRKLDRVLSKAKPQKSEPKEAGQLSEEDKEKIAREYLDKQGLTKGDTGLPSAGGMSFTREDIEKMSPGERLKKLPDIRKAISEGRFK